MLSINIRCCILTSILLKIEDRHKLQQMFPSCFLSTNVAFKCLDFKELFEPIIYAPCLGALSDSTIYRLQNYYVSIGRNLKVSRFGVLFKKNQKKTKKSEEFANKRSQIFFVAKENCFILY